MFAARRLSSCSPSSVIASKARAIAKRQYYPLWQGISSGCPISSKAYAPTSIQATSEYVTRKHNKTVPSRKSCDNYFRIGKISKSLNGHVADFRLRHASILSKQLHSASSPRQHSPVAVLEALIEDVHWSKKKAWKIFFGSQTGTANGFALQLQEELEGKGYDAEVIDMFDFDQSQIVDDANHIFILSCYGAGEPTDSAKKFYDWIMNSGDAAASTIADKTFAVFGLGSSKGHPHNYNVIGKRIDQQLEQFGGIRIFARGEGDDSECIELDFDEWQEKLLTHLEEAKLSPEASDKKTVFRPSTDAAAASRNSNTATAFTLLTKLSSAGGSCEDLEAHAQPIEKKPTKYSIVWGEKDTSQAEANKRLETAMKLFHPSNVVSFEVKDPRPLVPNFPRAIREMRIELTDPSLSYTTGDHVAVFPENSEDVVRRYLALYPQIDGDTPMILEINKGKNMTGPSSPGVIEKDPILALLGKVPVTIREVLTHFMDLTSPPTPKVIKDLAMYTKNGTSKDAVASLLSLADRNQYTQNVVSCRQTIIDLLEEHHADISYPIERLLEILPRLQPRYYSIASSSLVSPRECLIVYRHLQYTTSLSKERQGVCTTYLKGLESKINNSSDKNKEKATISALLRQSDFKLPKDIATPIIMVGGGTGIAPLRAFIEERLYLRREGKVPLSCFGPALLYFGARVPEELAYTDLISDAKAEGVLSHADIVFSHHGENPRFLAEDLNTDASNIWSATFGKDPNTHVYVCGGAAGFGMSVANAIKSLFVKYGGYSQTEADEWLRKAIQNKQYCEDLSD